MAKKKKKSIKSEYNQNKKNFIVVEKKPENYKILDIRAMKPRCYMSITNRDNCAVLQEIDEIKFDSKINGEKNILTYYTPNNVGILLSIANKSLERAKQIYDENINADKHNHLLKYINESEELIKKSVIVYDFIEAIQTSIVFGYTAVEAFTNLSIDPEYKYENDINNKGITEIYGKDAIERWLPLSVKVSRILVDIYKCKKIENDKIWTKFKSFEQYRNEIIHQKSIDSTNFYKKYFKKNIFEVCTVPEKIIKFFFDERSDKNSTNILWPWIVNGSNDFPVSHNMNADNFEIMGSPLFEK